MHGLYLHITIDYGGTLFTGSVMCFLSAWVLHIIIIIMAGHSLVHWRIGVKKKATMLTQLFAYFQSMGYVLPMLKSVFIDSNTELYAS